MNDERFSCISSQVNSRSRRGERNNCGSSSLFGVTRGAYQSLLPNTTLLGLESGKSADGSDVVKTNFKSQLSLLRGRNARDPSARSNLLESSILKANSRPYEISRLRKTQDLSFRYRPFRTITSISCPTSPLKFLFYRAYRRRRGREGASFRRKKSIRRGSFSLLRYLFSLIAAPPSSSVQQSRHFLQKNGSHSRIC